MRTLASAFVWPSSDEFAQVHLAPRQVLGRCLQRCSRADETSAEQRIEVVTPGGDGSDRVDEIADRRGLEEVAAGADRISAHARAGGRRRR